MPSDAAADPPRSSRPSRWKRVLLIVACTAFGLRLLLALITHFPGHAGAVTWPAHPGEVLRLGPGDKSVIAWDEVPENDGFTVYAIARDGIALPSPSLCALVPGLMADADQPGGTLTLVSRNDAGLWQVHWQGGPTMSKPETAEDVDIDCGRDAMLFMNDDQVHGFVDLLATPVPADAPQQ